MIDTEKKILFVKKLCNEYREAQADKLRAAGELISIKRNLTLDQRRGLIEAISIAEHHQKQIINTIILHCETL